MVLHAIESVLSLLLLIAVGWLLAGRKWFGQNGGQNLFSKYCINVAIPAYMVYNVYTIFETKEELFELFRALPVPFATMGISLALGFLLAKVFRVRPPRRGVFINAIAFSNTVIVGFPVITSLYGETSMPDAMIYYMANTILFWTIGAYLLRLDGPQKAKLFSPGNIRRIFSPPIIGFLIGVALVLLHVNLPAFVFSPLKMVKETTTAIAMMFIGSVMRTADYRSSGFRRDLIVVLAVRFLVSPVFMILVCRALPMPALMKQVFFVLSTMPCMTQLGIVAKESESDYHFSSVVVALSTAVSMGALPVYIFLITTFNLFD